MKKLLLFVLGVTFVIFLFFAESLLEDFVINKVEERINRSLCGKTEIGRFYLSGRGFVFRHIYSYSDASKEAKLVFSAGKVVVPYSYLLNPDNGFIIISKLHLNVLLDENYSLNLLRITKSEDKNKKDSFNLPTFPIRLKIKKSTFNTLLYINGERFLFKGKNTVAIAHIADNRIVYTSKCDGENIGKCSSEGVLDFNNLYVNLSHNFKKIKIDARAQHFLHTLFSFTGDFDMDGFVGIKIINRWDNRKILPPKYFFSFKDTDLFHRYVPLEIKDVFGSLKITDGKFYGQKMESQVVYSDLVFPVADASCEGDFSDQDEITIKDVEGKVFAGEAKGEVMIYPYKKCDVLLDVKGGDVPSLFKNMKSEMDPEKGAFNFKSIFEITKDAEKGWLADGTGDFEITDSKMGKIPFMLGLFAILDFSLPKKDNISYVSTPWVYRDGNLFLDKIVLGGKNIGFFGKGTVFGLKDLDISLAARLREAKPFSFPPVIGDITRFASNTVLKNLATVKISGTVDEPVFEK